MAVKAESKAPVISLVHEASAEGVISHVVYGVDRIENDAAGRFSVLPFGGFSRRIISPLKRAADLCAHSTSNYRNRRRRTII